jgi:hypothetical protein
VEQTTQTASAAEEVFSNVLAGMYTLDVEAKSSFEFNRKDVQVLPNSADASFRVAGTSRRVFQLLSTRLAAEEVANAARLHERN